MGLQRDGQEPSGYIGVNPIKRPESVIADRAPTTSDRRHKIGTPWIDKTNNTAYFLTSVVAGSATWALASPGASDVDTLTGDSGGALTPTAGNMNILGGTNLTVAGAGSTLTANMDAAITLATSVTSALYTTAAASDLLITAVSGQDVVMKLSDAAGAQKFSITDSADAEVFAVDSNGGQTYTTITASGLITAQASMTVSTAGTALNLGSDNSGDAVNLGVGTVARAIGIGDSAAAHTITMGSVTGAASVDLLVGTGNFTLEGNVASTYALSNTGVNTGAFSIAGGTGARTITIGGGGTGAKTINIGAAASADVITIGDSTGAGSLDLACGTGNFSVEGNVASTYSISNVGANTGAVSIGGGTGARTVSLGVGGTGVKTVNIATAAIGNIVTIGSVTAAASLDLLCGTGNFTLEGNVASTYDISNTGVNTGTVNIAGGTGARAINIGAGGTGAKTIGIGAAASADVITIGDSTGAGSLDLVCGTGNFTLEGATASTFEISSTGVNTGTCKFASGTGARTVEIAGGGTGIKTINIGAAATADVITIGTTTGAGSLVLAAGTGDITASGTFKEVNSEFAYSTGTDLQIEQSPIMQSAATTGVAPTGATGDVNLMYMQDGCLMEQFILGAGQTIIAPRMDATAGLLISLDLVDNEGAEYNFGARNNAKHAYVSQTAAAFFMEATFYVADLSGCEPLWMGFRKVEANNADYTNYTDYYVIGMNNATSATNATVGGRINSGGLTLTDTTDAWTEGGAQTVKILVSAAGVCTAEIGGSAVSVPYAQTFDSGDVLMPFIHFLHDTTTPGQIGLQTLKIGFQA